MIDRKTFFAVVRKRYGALKQSQVDGFNAILDEWESRNLTILSMLAYMLATTWHETTMTMQPIAEIGKGKGKPYGFPTQQYGGQIAYGRGFVQLTWFSNYQRADSELNLNGALLANFDLALRMDVAVRVLFDGMLEGWFARRPKNAGGKPYCLGDFFTPTTADYVGARRIINGTDRASAIAAYALEFSAALSAATVGATVSPIKPGGGTSGGAGASAGWGRPTGGGNPTPKPPSPPAGAAGGFWAVLVGWLLRIFRSASSDNSGQQAPRPLLADPPWLTIARRHLGVLEAAGAADNPVVVDFYRRAGFAGVKHDSVPWCAAFVGACLADAGVKPSGSLMALSYEKWGEALAGPIMGCIATKARAGGGHVFFVVGANATTVYALGGNQSDSVSITSIPRAQVTAWRWPAGAPRDNTPPLPMTITGAKAGGSEA